MGRNPSLPAGFTLPREVNGWRFDPEPYNGLTWTAADAEQAVVAFNHMDEPYVKVYDTRCQGYAAGNELARRTLTADEDEHDGTVWAAETAIEWMQNHGPGEWTHPLVSEAAFDAPEGYRLAHYYLETRDADIYYEATDPEPLKTLEDRRGDGVHNYLYVHAWRSSGSYTVATAPWTNAHDHEMDEIASGDSGGLEVALTIAHQHATGDTAEAPECGQQSLTGWSA